MDIEGGSESLLLKRRTSDRGKSLCNPIFPFSIDVIRGMGPWDKNALEGAIGLSLDADVFSWLVLSTKSQSGILTEHTVLC